MRTKALLLILGIGLGAPPALAWNGAGHRISASIAWNRLSAPARQQVSRLLQAHPDLARWQRQQKHYDSLEQSRVLFIEASTWADDIRHDSRYHDNDAETLSDTPDMMARHRDWHYENLPLTPGQGGPEERAPQRGQLTTRIKQLSAQLADRRLGDPERAYALVWLIHLVGDIHQPLHVVSRYDEEGNPDAGGNDQSVIDPANNRRPETSLHTYWDDLPGPSRLRGNQLLDAAQLMDSDIQHTPQKTVAAWRQESLQLARTRVYPGIDSNLVPVLDERYSRQAKAVADRRLVEAGRRLAGLLNRIWGK